MIKSGGILVEVPEADVIVAIPLRHDCVLDGNGMLCSLCFGSAKNQVLSKE